MENEFEAEKPTIFEWAVLGAAITFIFSAVIIIWELLIRDFLL